MPQRGEKKCELTKRMTTRIQGMRCECELTERTKSRTQTNGLGFGALATCSGAKQLWMCLETQERANSLCKHRKAQERGENRRGGGYEGRGGCVPPLQPAERNWRAWGGAARVAGSRVREGADPSCSTGVEAYRRAPPSRVSNESTQNLTRPCANLFKSAYSNFSTLTNLSLCNPPPRRWFSLYL